MSAEMIYWFDWWQGHRGRRSQRIADRAEIASVVAYWRRRV